MTTLGVAGDRQENTEVHGGPERAVSFFSLERILALHAEGHPIFPGSVGENVTISGLDWEQVLPGTRLRLGAEVLVELTKYTTPCNKIEGLPFGMTITGASPRTNTRMVAPVCSRPAAGGD